MSHAHSHQHEHRHHDHDHDHEHEHEQEQEHDHTPPPPQGLVRALYVDATAGASGDMFLGALVDLGVSFEDLRSSLAALRVPGFKLTTGSVKRHTIACTKVDVVVEEEEEHVHRHVGDLVQIVERAELPARVKERSVAILGRLARAEATAHRMPVDHVHLHEVGGLDCLVDIVGTCLGIEMLGADRIFCGPVAVGTGHVACAHGNMPLPAPGTLELLKDFPIRRTQFEGEMTTPTAAAIISELAEPLLVPVIMIPRRIGYGAGTKDKQQLANMLSLIKADVPFRGLPK